MGFSKGRVVAKRMSLAYWYKKEKKVVPVSPRPVSLCFAPGQARRNAEGTSGGLTIRKTVCGQPGVKVLNILAARSILFIHASRPLIHCDILLILPLIFINISMCSIFRMVHIYSTLFGPSSPSWTLRQELADAS